MFKKKREFDTIRNSHQLTFVLVSFLVIFLILSFLSPRKDLRLKPNFTLENSQNRNIFLTRLHSIFEDETEKKLKAFNLNDRRTIYTYNLRPFENLGILAKSYVVYDVANQKVIFSKNENEILPLASLTKVAAALTMLHLASSTTDIVVKKALLNPDQRLDFGLKENQKWKMGEILKFALIYSSNPAMDIITNTISNKKSKDDFIKAMNSYIPALGFKDLVFTNSSGLDYGEKFGGQGSALTYAKLFAKSYALMPEILSYTTNSRANIETQGEKIYAIQNTNKKAGEIVGLLASKTGYTEAAGGNLAILFDLWLDQPIVIVVLGSTLDGRFQDVATLYKATKNSLVKGK